MTNHYDREQFWTLIFDTIDSLEKLESSKELINIVWDVNTKKIKTEKDWKRTELLLESYEKTRDETLKAALSNLKELVNALSGST